jgi:hypothetical protein
MATGQQSLRCRYTKSHLNTNFYIHSSSRILTLEVFGGHHVIGPTVGLAGNDGQLGHSSLSIGVEQFGSVTDDSVMLLNKKQ